MKIRNTEEFVDVAVETFCFQAVQAAHDVFKTIDPEYRKSPLIKNNEDFIRAAKTMERAIVENCHEADRLQIAQTNLMLELTNLESLSKKAR